MTKYKYAFFAVITTVLVIVFIEVALNILVWANGGVKKLLASPYTSAPSLLPDKTLVYRPNPDYPEHDSRGYRNPEERTKADIVVLGDSQAYGTGVTAEEAWPNQLGQITNNTVYNMAVPSYGPVHSLILWDEVMSMRPKVVIEALYAGNDLYDSFNIVYNYGQHSELRTTDALLQQSLYKKEAEEPLADTVERNFLMGVRNKTAGKDASRRSHIGIEHIWEHSRIYGLVQKARYCAARTLSNLRKSIHGEWGAAQLFAQKHPAYCAPFSDETHKTVFTPEYRLSVLSLRDKRIAEGCRISLEAIERMNNLAVRHRIRFFVVLTPTKEFVFRQIMQDVPSRLQALTDNERVFWRIVKNFCKEKGIKYIDALPALHDQLANGEQPYPVSHDGHPNRYGHAAMARAVKAHLESSAVP